MSVSDSILLKNRSPLTRYIRHPVLLTAIGGILLLGSWQYLVANGIVTNVLIPAPGEILSEFLRVRDLIFEHLWITLFEAIVGFFIASVLAFLLALVMTLNQTIKSSLMPLVVAGTSVPRVSLAPLIIFYLGGEMFVMYIIAAWIAFFPMLVNTTEGLSLRDDNQEDLLAVYGATTSQEIRYIRLPNALPHIFDGMKQAANLAIIGAVVGEFLVATEGIGYLVILSLQSLQFTLAMAIVLIMGVVGVVVLVGLYFLQNRVVFWREATIYGGLNQ